MRNGTRITPRNPQVVEAGYWYHHSDGSRREVTCFATPSDSHYSIHLHLDRLMQDALFKPGIPIPTNTTTQATKVEIRHQPEPPQGSPPRWIDNITDWEYTATRNDHVRISRDYSRYCPMHHCYFWLFWDINKNNYWLNHPPMDQNRKYIDPVTGRFKEEELNLTWDGN